VNPTEAAFQHSPYFKELISRFKRDDAVAVMPKGIHQLVGFLVGDGDALETFHEGSHRLVDFRFGYVDE
jgi:hypothetical protein